MLVFMDLSIESRCDSAGKTITEIMARRHPGNIKVPIAQMVGFDPGSDGATNKIHAEYLLWAWDSGLKCRAVCEALIHLKGPSGRIGGLQAEHLDKTIESARKALADVRPKP